MARGVFAKDLQMTQQDIIFFGGFLTLTTTQKSLKRNKKCIEKTF